jgi:hypothetical protein
MWITTNMLEAIDLYSGGSLFESHAGHWPFPVSLGSTQYFQANAVVTRRTLSLKASRTHTAFIIVPVDAL